VVTDQFNGYQLQLPDRLHIDLDMRPLTASPARTALPVAHFERNDVIIICETVH
jgi:hypothetical protein